MLGFDGIKIHRMVDGLVSFISSRAMIDILMLCANVGFEVSKQSR